MQTAGLIDPDRAALLLEARDPALFAERLLGLAHSATGVEELFAYRVGDGAPQALASSSGLGDVRERAEAYARRFHASDPAAAARRAARPGSGFACRIPAEAIELGAYRRLCFERPRFAEKICFGWRKPEATTVVTFYARSGGAAPDMAQLGALAQLAITGLTRNAAPAVPLVEEVERRLAAAHPSLTGRERGVCARSLAGETAREIGHALGLSPATVLTYRQRAYQKLGPSRANDLLAAVMG
ncbi:helix-turn-helix transcriptional regulator [Sinirhodobacter huangdaonensis]|uniref:LuxR family transcriptional regulator n=1 Tax=Paenirhodobacter huangdaonensis TaxID=2501515 RepID=A0A3S4MC50_9RHOB|nr:helix-turn-helix transcriptional regulator [Sinirhodobacter huangdaonensis]RWR47203.1 LuxR family transcriptional regulator [Sinirhodobacter huangdaonensis]